MWEIEYRKEARDYIYDSYPYTEIVWQTLKSLRNTEDGLPPTNWREIAVEIFLWEVAEHIVIYERDIDQNKLIFLVVKPMNGDIL